MPKELLPARGEDKAGTSVGLQEVLILEMRAHLSPGALPGDWGSVGGDLPRGQNCLSF